MTRRTAADPDRLALRSARVRNRLLTEQLAGRRLQRAALRESSSGPWIEPFTELLNRWRYDFDFRGPSSRNDRRWGRDYPLYQNEMELRLLRAPSRILMATNPYAQGLFAGIAAYVLGPKTDIRYGCDEPPVQKAAQKVIDAVLELNEWHGGQEGALERELFERRFEDGEWFLRHTARADGLTDFRVLDADQITEPPGSDFRVWGFGHYTEPDDPHLTLALWAMMGETPTDGIELDRDEFTFCRRNVKRGMKRGLPDYCTGVYDLLRQSNVLVTDLAEGAAEQASIVGIREHTGATIDQVQSFVDGQEDYQQLDATLRRLESIQRRKSGRWEDIPSTMKYVPPPTASNAPMHLDILQAALRACCRKWQPPEGLISGDSSNNNFASSLTAESPFVRCVQAEQGQTKPLYVRLGTIALKNWCDRTGGVEVLTPDGSGVARTLTFAELRRMGKVEAEMPSPETRDKDKEATRLKLENEAGVTSIQTWGQLIGRDPDKEEKLIAEWKAKHPDPLPGDGAPGEGGPGQQDQGGGDPPQDGPPDPVGGNVSESLLLESGMFDPSKHPRDKNGQYIPVHQLVMAMHDPAKADELRARVHPDDRRNLERRLTPTPGTNRALKRDAAAKIAAERDKPKEPAAKPESPAPTHEALVKLRREAAALAGEVHAHRQSPGEADQYDAYHKGERLTLLNKQIADAEGRLGVPAGEPVKPGPPANVSSGSSTPPVIHPDVLTAQLADAEKAGNTKLADAIRSQLPAAGKSVDPNNLKAGEGGADADAVASAVKVGDTVTVAKSSGGHETGAVQSVKRQVRKEPVFSDDPGVTADGESERSVVSVTVKNSWGQTSKHTFYGQRQVTRQPGASPDAPAKPAPAAPAPLHEKIPVYVRGDVRQVRDYIQKAGGHWDRDAKAWVVHQGVAKKLRDLAPHLQMTVPKDVVKFFHPERFRESEQPEDLGGWLLEVKDASGHEHKGEGPGGGQFTGPGKDGDDSSDETPVQRLKREQMGRVDKWLEDSGLKELGYGEQADQFRKSAQHVISNMAHGAVKRFDAYVVKMTFHASSKWVTLHAKSDGDEFDGECGGFYDRHKHELVVNGGIKGGLQTHEVYAHEFAHAVDGPSGAMSKEVEWFKAWTEEINLLDSPLSKYAKTDPVEGFAEFGRLVYTGRYSDAKAFPKCFAFFKSKGIA